MKQNACACLRLNAPDSRAKIHTVGENESVTVDPLGVSGVDVHESIEKEGGSQESKSQRNVPYATRLQVSSLPLFSLRKPVRGAIHERQLFPLICAERGTLRFQLEEQGKERQEMATRDLPREEGVGHGGHAHGSTGVTRVGLGDDIGGQASCTVAIKAGRVDKGLRGQSTALVATQMVVLTIPCTTNSSLERNRGKAGEHLRMVAMALSSEAALVKDMMGMSMRVSDGRGGEGRMDEGEKKDVLGETKE